VGVLKQLQTGRHYFPLSASAPGSAFSWVRPAHYSPPGAWSLASEVEKGYSRVSRALPVVRSVRDVSRGHGRLMWSR
jgi:hypothetical protein